MVSKDDLKCKVTLECEYIVQSLGLNIDVKPDDSTVNYTYECNECLHPSNITNNNSIKHFHVIKIKSFNY